MSDIHNDLELLKDIMSSSDEEMDDIDKDKDYVPTQQQQLFVDLDEVNIDDLPIDINIFLNNDYLENELINVEVDNVSNPNISGEFNFVKSGQSPKKFKKVRFREEQGPVDKNIYKMPPIDIFQLMIGPILQTIVQQTNLYAQQKSVNINTSIEEIKAFIGILIFMGYHSLPSIRLYWSNDPNFFCERVAKIMPVKRFLKILRLLHLNDNSQMPSRNSLEFDKLYKIRPMITHLKDIYQSVYRPSRYLAVDESMVAYKGRSTMKQYMPMKPIKRGFKIWALADSYSGFLLNLDIYTGKKSNGIPEYGLGENVVLYLTKKLKNLFYCVFFDNFFTSIPLIFKLLCDGIFACGTFRVNKKYYPKHLMKTDGKYNSGDIEYAQSEDIGIMRWKDRGSKPVTLVSNMHNSSDTSTVLRKNGKGERIQVKCPTGISDYNKYMGGVDKFDQYMSPYSISQKSRKWWIKLFYYMVDTAIVNSYILYKESCNKNKKKYITHLEFRSRLTDELIGNFSCRKKCTSSPHEQRSKKKQKLSINHNFTGVDHMPKFIDKYRRCKMCSTKAKEKRSNMICSTCEITLCKQCFEPYHKPT